MIKESRPLLGITMGDPAGIGPEITAKMLNKKEIYNICKPLVVGDYDVMKEGCEVASIDLEINCLNSPLQGRYQFGAIDLLDMDNVDINQLTYGKVSKTGGSAALEYIEKVIDLAMSEKIDATVTNPIHKKAINMAGSSSPGHTEIYKKRTGAKNVSMMLVKDQFRVVHVSTHVSLKEACDLVTKERVYRVIKLAHNALINLGVSEPIIAVPGLNPHAGEGGLFGNEEEKEIKPAIRKAQENDMRAIGPIPPDTVFAKAKGGKYDVCLALYHDQGHIPAKLAGFIWDKQEQKWAGISGVNVTLGLPIIRTSVDHGVAFDKAGQGEAIPDSLIEATKLATKFSRSYWYLATPFF